MRRFTFLIVLLCGCGGINPGINPDPVEVTGKVTSGGRPVNDVTLVFHAIKGGVQASVLVRQGQFTRAVVPGTYTYYFTKGASPAGLTSVPEKYRAGDMERQLQITNGCTLDLLLN